MEYRSITNGIEIEVQPEYIDSQINDSGSIFIWSYRITIKNHNKETFQLINRYWRIIDQNGEVQEISGNGVVGEQPILDPNNIFEYTSGVHLNSESGIMGGHYEMKRSDGKTVNIKIPTFSLDIPNSKTTLN